MPPNRANAYRAELVAFLRRLDALLTERAVLEVVGGAAAVLMYGARSSTKDIDTWTRVPRAVQAAAAAVIAMGEDGGALPREIARVVWNAVVWVLEGSRISSVSSLGAPRFPSSAGRRDGGLRQLSPVWSTENPWSAFAFIIAAGRSVY